MKSRIIKLIVLILLVIFAFPLIGCHGFITIYGRVYEWVDAPSGSNSFIYMNSFKDWRDHEIVLKELNERILEDIETSPLDGVKITVSGELGADESYYTVTSNITGAFELEQLANGGKYPIEIKASKNGYIDADGKTIYDLDYAHVFAVVVVLVRDQSIK